MKIVSRKKLLQKGGFFGRLAPQRNKFGRSSGTISHPLDRLRREIAVLQKVDHPNIVKLVEVLDDPAQDSLYLVFELLELGPVADVPNGNRMEETQARKYFNDLLLGIQYLHRNHIVHRDIKPANLLLGRDGRLRIADFGVCAEFDGSEDVLLDNTVGTPAFVAPEQLAGQFYGKAADIWAMGITLYVLIYGILPFSDTNVLALYESIRNRELCFPSGVQDSTSALLKDLLARMLCKDPSQRITLAEMKEHAWVIADSPQSFRKENRANEIDQSFVDELLPVVFSVQYLASLMKTVFFKHSVRLPFQAN
ncbi:calcium/calmodulin-dependent protein kinase kinase 2-like [Daphnia carinata]|uniref:calcium/calmodulin-dependent protein kinase kinase 2-like n=1 Tax=Daphnia carinata TaxID=120202 RepID=UPI002868819F|nr:calcium/calmodulin-dependent protein kinase kinase 2-like [Daphnia carinata]